MKYFAIIVSSFALGTLAFQALNQPKVTAEYIRNVPGTECIASNGGGLWAARSDGSCHLEDHAYPVAALKR